MAPTGAATITVQTAGVLRRVELGTLRQNGGYKGLGGSVRGIALHPSQHFALTTVGRYDMIIYNGKSTLQKTTACLSSPQPAKSYEMRSPDDEKARAALEAAQAKAAAEAASAAAAKKAKDDADAKAAAAAKAVADAKAKAAADAAALLAVKADRKRLAVKAKNDALEQAKTKLNGHVYQVGFVGGVTRLSAVT